MGIQFVLVETPDRVSTRFKPVDIPIHYQGKSVADCTCDTFLLQTVTYLPSKLLCNTMRQ